MYYIVHSHHDNKSDFVEQIRLQFRKYNKFIIFTFFFSSFLYEFVFKKPYKKHRRYGMVNIKL